MNKKIFIVTVILLFIIGAILTYDMRNAQVDAMLGEFDPICGDGYIGKGEEECDDGNVVNSDGCSSTCKVEDLVQTAYPCSDGSDNDDDGRIDSGDPGCHTDWDVNNYDSYQFSHKGEYEIVRTSIAVDGTDGNDYSEKSSVSADGRYIAFGSYASNLVQGDNNDIDDIFLYDRFKGETKRISVSAGKMEANGSSINPSISADGRYIAFESYASNLVQDDNNDSCDIFVYDSWTDTVSRISVLPNGEEGVSYSDSPLISPDGNYVQFYSMAANLIGASEDFYGDYLVCNLRTNEITILSAIFVGNVEVYPLFSATSADRRYVAFTSFDDIFVYDVVGKINKQVDVSSSGEQANDRSSTPSISSNGRYVTFESEADNLVSGDNNDNVDVFVHDQVTGQTSRISVGQGEEEGREYSVGPSMSANGEYITFHSLNWKFVPGDRNGTGDSFLVRNPLFEGGDNAPTPLVDLKQRNESDGAEIGVGRIINEGASESVDSVILSAKVKNPDGGRVSLEVEIKKMNDAGEISSIESMTSTSVTSGGVASIDYVPTGGGLYSWKARTVDESGNKCDWLEFGDNGEAKADFISSNFSFVFMTDVHLGGNLATLATADAIISGKGLWYESRSYPRFTDVLYNINNLSQEPDFILIGGDNVEYDNTRWLQDFKSITEDFSERTGIEIYFVPGNHDRYNSESTAVQWGETDLSGGNDNLVNYFSVAGDPSDATSLFADNEDIMDDEQSKEGGLNKYNYYFYHDGFQFVGLDTGEDTGVWDFLPEGRGINAAVIERMEQLLYEDSNMPRVLFMHNPVYNLGLPSEEWDNDLFLGNLVPNGSVTNNWHNLIDFCNISKTQLILSGHTHSSQTFNRNGSAIDLSDWITTQDTPIYLQTQSSGKGNDYGYRVVDIINGRAIPQDSKINVRKYEKVFTDLDAKDKLASKIYDSAGNEMTSESGEDGVFTIPVSDRHIIYENTESIIFEVTNENSFKSEYNLRLQKRVEGGEPDAKLGQVSFYLITNRKMCGLLNPTCFAGTVSVRKNEQYVTLDFKGINVEGDSTHRIAVDWGDLPNFDINKVSFDMDGNSNTSYIKLLNRLTIDINSPGELRAMDDSDRVTGLVNGEMVENIPYSMYIPESETVYIFRDAQEDIVKDFKTRVVGSYESTYDFSISLSEDDAEISSFVADDVPIDGQTAHQFSVDWDVLEQGGAGVKLDFDENSDGIFERTIFLDENLDIPEAELNAEKYTVNEGDEITFISTSSDSDGSIVLYEWDLDGDGTFDEQGNTPSKMVHKYGDDFQRNVLLRVTDNEGLTDTTGAEVIVVNVKPIVSISKFEIADTMDKFLLEGNYIDSGWLDTHTILIDWADGNVENIFPDAAGKISATHKYGKLENYVLKLIVSDDDGGVALFETILNSPRQIKRDALLRLKAIQTDEKNARKEIDKAIKILEDSLGAKYWKDDFHLNPSHISKFYSEERKASSSLSKVLDGKKIYKSFQYSREIIQIIEDLSESDLYLAKIIVYDSRNQTMVNLMKNKSKEKKLKL